MKTANQLMRELVTRDSCFSLENIRELNGRLYESLVGLGHKYRVVLNVDDYDYVEDKELIAKLDRLFSFPRNDLEIQPNPKLQLSISACSGEVLNRMSFNQVMEFVLSQYELLIVAWLCKHRDINPYTYEGGIHSWWGVGSVTSHELALCFRLEVEAQFENIVTFTIEG